MTTRTDPTSTINVVIDRRTRSAWADRRDDAGHLPPEGLRSGRIARGVGRRREDRESVTWLARPAAHEPVGVQPKQGFIEPTGAYYMPSGQRIA